MIGHALEGELLTELHELQAIAPEWEHLATVNALPLSLPEWSFAWLRHMAPAGAAPRVVAVRDKGSLVGLVPMFVEEAKGGRIDYRLLGSPCARLSPLAIPGREWEVARVAGRVLRNADPCPDAIALEAHPLASVWPTALTHMWPSAVTPVRTQYSVHSSLTVTLRQPCFDSWLATKSKSYRTEMRHKRREFEKAGGTVRVSTPETVRGDVAALIDLHRERWRARGSSTICANEAAWQAYYTDVGEAYAADGRFRLTVLEIDGAPICLQLATAAGGEIMTLNGGWDETYARLSPAVLCLVAKVQQGIEHGDSRLDLAMGEQSFKLRLADSNNPIAWTLIMVPNARLALTAARTAPMLTRRAVRGAAKRALSDEKCQRMRDLRHALRG